MNNQVSAQATMKYVLIKDMEVAQIEASSFLLPAAP